MPITLAHPPQAVEDLTKSKITEISNAGHFRIQSLATAKPEQIHLASGHAVYNLGLDDIAASKPLSELTVSSWRFIVRTGAEPSAAETLPATTARSAEFSSVNSGPFVSGTTDAFESVMQNPAFANGDWELRLLRVPALYIFAVWAHKQDGSDDQLQLVNPTPSFLSATKLYHWNEFLAAVKPEATERLATTKPS